MEIVDIFKSLADETRVRMLNLLRYGELCVCDIETVLGIQQSNASRHLNKLKTAGLIVSEKKSQWVYYRFNTETFQKYHFLDQIINDEIVKISNCQEDLARLKEHKATGVIC
ncbi:MAG: metalloregulator ArsR/SmtB family transcription factor [Syntrophomonas sp.]